jgi:hypothetical protein
MTKEQALKGQRRITAALAKYKLRYEATVGTSGTDTYHIEVTQGTIHVSTLHSTREVNDLIDELRIQ